MRRSSYLVLAAAGILGAGSVEAAATYSYATDRGNYDLSQGQNLVKVYLVEAGSPTQIGGGSGGLNAAGFAASRLSGSSVKMTDMSFNALFDFTLFNSIVIAPDGASGVLLESAASAGVVFEATTTRVYLGSIMLGADTGSGLTQMTIGDPDPQFFGDITNNQGLSLDNPPPAALTFTVAVPEPTTLGLMGVGTLLALRRRRTV